MLITFYNNTTVQKPPRPRSLMIVPTPKLISLEEAQELSKIGKLTTGGRAHNIDVIAAAANAAAVATSAHNSTAPTDTVATTPVKLRDHDKSKTASERRFVRALFCFPFVLCVRVWFTYKK